MALLDFEGCAQENNAAIGNWWSVAPNAIGAAGSGPYGEGRYFWRYASKNHAANQSLWFNFHYYKQAGAGSAYDALDFRDGGTQQLILAVSNANVFVIKKGSGATLATASGPTLSNGVWYFVQLRYTISTTVGTVELWVNGAQVATYSGNTQVSGNASCDRFVILEDYFCNMAFYTESGAAPNARTPECRVYTGLPTSAGSVTGFVPSAGANWQCTDENPSNADTDYVSAAAAVTDDLYVSTGAQVAAGVVVYAVGVESVVRKDDAGVNAADVLIKTGATTAAGGAPLTLSTSYQRHKAFWSVNPATGLPWTVGESNAVEFGVRRTS